MPADFDREIDRAVREMLDVEPRADLRARVMSRLAAPKPRSGGVRWEWIAAPVAAAAPVLLALLLRPAPSLQSLPIAQVVNLPRVDLPAEAGSHEPAVDLPAKAGRHEPVHVAWLSPPGEHTTVEIAPLAAPAPIALRSIEPRPINPAAVTVDALPAITPIAIEPLPPGRH